MKTWSNSPSGKSQAGWIDNPGDRAATKSPMTFSPPHLMDGQRWAGKRIGLLGGSFNPPHEGHLHISLIALQSLKLDYIWWLVTPQNPLKEASSLAPYEDRVRACRSFVHHPQILITDLERQLDVNRSYDTVCALNKAFPQTQFVWITGMDNALNFHRWHRWRDILGEIATAHVARPPAWSLIEACPLRMLASQKHHYLNSARKAELAPGHTYWLLQKKMLAVSSTEIRQTR